MARREEIIRLFSMKLRSCMETVELDYEHLYEIRLRTNSPVILIYNNEEFFLSQNGGMTKEEANAYILQQKEVKETMEYISNFSLYAFEEEIRQGFITVQGGHRVGLVGKVFFDKGCIRNLKYISSMNIRISHEVKGIANTVLPYLVSNGQFLHTLIISPPRGGKTTLLRDCIRQLSDGTHFLNGQCIGVVDERSELGGSYFGVLQNDLGKRTDVLDCCPKTEGMQMLIRSMAPDIIAVDELGGTGDAAAIENACVCGCRILATVHGNSIDDIRQKPVLQEIMKQNIFERYVVLRTRSRAGEVAGIYDREGRRLC